MTVQKCNKCLQIKDVGCFYFRKEVGFYRKTCKQCYLEQRRLDRIARPDVYKERDVKNATPKRAAQKRELRMRKLEEYQKRDALNWSKYYLKIQT